MHSSTRTIPRIHTIVLLLQAIIVLTTVVHLFSSISAATHLQLPSLGLAPCFAYYPSHLFGLRLHIVKWTMKHFRRILLFGYSKFMDVKSIGYSCSHGVAVLLPNTVKLNLLYMHDLTSAYNYGTHPSSTTSICNSYNCLDHLRDAARNWEPVNLPLLLQLFMHTMKIMTQLTFSMPSMPPILSGYT